MHLILIATALTMAFLIRLIPIKSTHNSGISNSWAYNLSLFIFPPLILIMTALAIIFMGYHGKMLGFPISKIGYILSLIFIAFAIISLIKLSYQSHLSLHKIKTYPLKLIQGKSARIIDVNFPYAGQIGFWHSELIISKELIELLSPEHLEAVMAHEEAHYNYRDTFCFFWLGYLKNFTFWLPNTEKLWYQILLLRELRADQKAVEKVDFLVLAESLLFVTQASLNSSENFNPDLSCAFSNHSLNERIENLLNPSPSKEKFSSYTWASLILTLLPWFTILFHY